MDEYEKKARDFLESARTKLTIKFLEWGRYFSDNTENRNIYRFTLKNERGEYSSKFGQSLNDSAKNIAPSEYSILACLDLYHDDFASFCYDYGFSEDSIKARKTYKAVIKQTKALEKIFSSDELEQLQEIR